MGLALLTQRRPRIRPVLLRFKIRRNLRPPDRPGASHRRRSPRKMVEVAGEALPATSGVVLFEVTSSLMVHRRSPTRDALE